MVICQFFQVDSIGMKHKQAPFFIFQTGFVVQLWPEGIHRIFLVVVSRRLFLIMTTVPSATSYQDSQRLPQDRGS